MVPFSLESLLAALDGVDGLALQVHQDFKPIYCTRDYARIFGFDSPDDFLTLPSILDIVPPEHHDAAKQRYQLAVKEGYTEPLQIKSRKPDGEVIWIRVQDQLMHHGSQVYMLTFIEDISGEVQRQEQLSVANLKQKEAYQELQELQGKLIEREKIASLRNVVVGFAHEINTPLGVAVTSSSHIKSLSSDIRKAYETRCLTSQELGDFLDTLDQANEMMERQLSHTSDMISSFKLVAAEETENDCVELNLAGYLRDVISTYTKKFKRHNIHLHIDLQSPWPSSFDYPTVWAHVMSNLIDNAIAHGFNQSGDGEVTISLKKVGDTVEFMFKDNGVGMSEDVRKMAFDPFFTSKRGSACSGLGLYIIYNLVTQTLGGTIDCQTAPDKGCEFRIRVPSNHQEMAE